MLKLVTDYSGVCNWDSRFGLDVVIDSFPTVNESSR